MKKFYFLAALAVCMTATTLTTRAQSDDGISDLFQGSPSDVNKLMGAYTSPLFKGFGNSLNGGWTNTARTLDRFHFAVRVTASASIIPQADRTFNINSLNLANIKPQGSPIAQTFGGDENLETGITFTDPNNSANKYNTKLPAGVTKFVPAPQVQLTVGLIKHTDLSIRFIPTTKITDDVGKVGMFGLGLKHNFANDFGKNALPFDLALAVGYTRLSYEKTLDVRPDASNGGVNGNSNFTNQSLEGNFSGFNTQVILSKKLMFFTPFVSLGYLTSSTDVGLKGNFPFVTGVDNAGKPIYTSYANPINISGKSASVSGVRADLGFQLNLSILRIYASGSIAEYKSVNAGIGFGF